jgi:hypothetical protein
MYGGHKKEKRRILPFDETPMNNESFRMGIEDTLPKAEAMYAFAGTKYEPKLILTFTHVD